MTSRIHALLQKTESWWSELCLGIDTRGAVAPPTQEGVHYTPLPYSMIYRMRTFLRLDAEDVFYDIGCGKGRVVCCMSQLPIKRVVAIELNPVLLEQTMGNVAKLRKRKCPVEAVHRSAEDCDYSDATVAYLYNPFNARLTAKVIEKLSASWTSHPRNLKIIYANPVHEDVFQANHWLEKYAEWPASDFPVFGYRVSFWRSAAMAGPK